MRLIAVNIIGGARVSPDVAIRELKRKMQRELIYRLMKTQRYYEPDSIKKVRKNQEATRRRTKLNRSRRAYN